MTKKDYIYIYDNVGDFVEWLQKTKQTRTGAKRSGSTRMSESFERYSKTASFEAAQELLDKGDTTLSRTIMEQSMNIKAKSKTGYMRSNGIVNGPQGFVPNIGAYMTGHPNNMVNIQRTFKPTSKVISIVYDITVDDYVTTNKMISAAAKVSCVIYTLEAKGYHVNVYISSGIRNGHTQTKNMSKFIIKIKDAGKPLDPLRIAYPLAHPSMLRRHALAFYERADYKFGKKNYGYIVPLTTDEARPLIGNCVVLCAQSIIYGDNTFEAIAKQIEEQSNVRR